MSSEAVVETTTTEVVQSDVCCANCGIAEVDDIKLKECDGCDLVKYCSERCREDHREQHDEECKRRTQELRDKKLFRQPDISHRGECPLCFLPLPLHPKKSTFYSCCSKSICLGCVYSNERSGGGSKCPFCRELVVEWEDDKKKMTERIKANDPAAMREMGTYRYSQGQEGDYDKAFEYWTKAAELGDVDAHYNLGYLYHEGGGVEKDEEKAVYHWEKAAIGGHHIARHYLACIEHNNGNIERAVKHSIIAANLGYEKSMKELWEYYSHGNITKEDLDATLRTHHAAINEMKSPEREAAEAFFQFNRQFVGGIQNLGNKDVAA